MGVAVLIGKIETHLRPFGPLAHQAFNRLLTEEGYPVQRIGYPVGHGGFPGSVIPGDVGDVPESIAFRFRVAAEGAEGQGGNFYGSNLFHMDRSSFQAVQVHSHKSCLLRSSSSSSLGAWVPAARHSISLWDWVSGRRRLYAQS